MNKYTVELLEKHFDTAFAAPDGIKKLRELILTLAMQGRLVPQDPSDQPASELLKEIEAEKQRMVKEGKIRKPKPLPPVTEGEKPYALPQGWEWARLQHFSDYNGRPNIDPREIPGDTWLLDLEDIEKETSRLLCRAKYSQRDSKSTKSTFKKGDVLYGKLRPYLDKVLVADSNGVCTTEIVPIVPSKAVIPDFLKWLLKRPDFLFHVNSLMYGVKMPRLGTEDAILSVHPLPPLNEQHRVVAKIDELMARCDELEKLRVAQQEKRLTVHAAAIRQLLNITEPDQHRHAQAFLAKHFGELYTVKENVAELRKAILRLAVMGKLVPQNPDDQPASKLLKEIEAGKQRLVQEGKIKKPKPLPPITKEEKPYILPQRWEWVRLGNVGAFERGRSKHRPRNDKRLFEHGTYPFVQTGDVSRSKFTENQILTCSSYYNEFGLKQSHLWKKGTLCITIAANIAETGFLGMDACIPDSVVAFLGINQTLEKLVKIFINVAKEDLEHFAPSTAQKNINLGIINELLFPLPPLSEQKRIVAKIDELMALCDSLDQKIDAATSKQAELLSALIRAQSQGGAVEGAQRSSRSTAQVIDLANYRANIGCYAINKLANAQYFGRTAAAKVMYLAQAHIGLGLDLKPEREAAGPLDIWIYDFERQGQSKGWFEVNEKTLASGRKKTEYRCLSALSEPSAKAEKLMSSEQKAEFDRLIYALADKKTEEVEIIATLFAVWNDFLIDGIQPTDEQIIRDMRENWHERKARFSPSDLKPWLSWLRKEGFIPSGLPPRTAQLQRLDV
ncbi:restriction endonuclease subunit S [Lonsdalea quercina]|uniref:restriction endonuclease subunit S n=1 Tax=Lonsdalea quercina TaxID=71657 RepID=UPI003975B5A5